jgi:hypothetical protein
MGVFCRMDTMVGKDFEHGLASLKALPEKYPRNNSAGVLSGLI